MSNEATPVGLFLDASFAMQEKKKHGTFEITEKKLIEKVLYVKQVRYRVIFVL